MKSYEGTFGEQLGEAVKRIRAGKDMSQEELRQEAGLSTGYISRLEAGEYTSPSIAQIYALAKALGLTLRDLLEDARLISEESTFEGCLRGEGLNEDQIQRVIEYKQYLVYTTKNDPESIRAGSQNGVT